MPTQQSLIPNLQPTWAWECARISALVFPWFPALGAGGLAIASIGLWKQQYRRLVQIPFIWGLLLLSLWLIFSSCFAVNRQEAFLGLANFLPFMALVAAFSFAIQKPSQLRQLAWLLVIPSFPIVILGLGQLFASWNSPPFLAQILGWELVPGGEPPGRMSSVFMYANILAAYLVIVFILGLGLWIDTYQAWRWDLKQRDRIWMLGWLGLVVISDSMGLILTQSRNAWALAFLACLAFALYLGWRWLVGGVAAAASSVLWSSWGPSPSREWLRQIVPAYFWARLSDEMYPDRPLATLRSTQWQFAWDMMAQRPWMGWGLRNFTPLYEAKMGLWLGHPHNLFLMLLAEIGIPGTLLLSGLVGWVIFEALRLIKNWSAVSSKEVKLCRHSDRLILFTYLVAFGSCVLFNMFDVTVFDLRVNTIGWLLLSAISGIAIASRDRVLSGFRHRESSLS
ncbi:lipid A core-O-antigen ligase-like enyme [Pleurocapsa sp. PCC 7327]|uniref:O-antigen ligase family protein n=1 Tax=Pleurocapsa sp. PCC 7327 TaxID=118163 RepID=UPI00029FA669|nr:O-antigen ligase family protein [Pleurocapsa sp. PCC 7327]AFY75739.1 lipid A core-O-antigen ligase-like enyme [Pleurocapsa sp. PCC 7327]